jgi:cystathionine beta-lyase
MGKYNFDEIVERAGTNSVKYDLREERFGKSDIIPMWVADMDFKTPDFIIEAIKERLDHPVLAYSIRSEEWYQSIIDWQLKRHQWQVEKDWIQYSPGVVPGLVMSILGMTKPGDEIIVQPPVYFPFFSSVEENDRKCVHNPLILKDGRYHFDLKDFEEKAKTAKMLLLCNPANPTGTAWTKEELKAIGDICVKHKLIIVSDEIHSDLIYKPFKHIPMASISKEIAKQTVTFMAPSKTFNVAALSSSYAIISNKRWRAAYERMMNATHLFIGNIAGNVGLEAAYTHGEQWLEEMIEYLQNNRDYVSNFLKEKVPLVKMVPAEATYLLWLDFEKTGLSHEEINNKLINEASLGFNDGMDFGKNGRFFYRMNIACPKSTVEKALIALEKVFG